MKIILLIFCLLFITVTGFSQQFSQYNTGTLYDSFENPAQRSFIPDTSKTYAFNFLIPNFNANFSLTGNAQSTLVSRVFGGQFNNSALQIGSGSLNNSIFNANVYALMFKVFGSLNGDTEIGIFGESRMEGRGSFTDETVALLSGPPAFPNSVYDNVFNDHLNFQIYNSIGVSYREKITRQFAVGFKLGILMGVNYDHLDIDESHVNFNNATDETDISLRGKYRISQGPGKFDSRSFLPTTRSPGAQLSIGTSYKTEDGITFQGNLKDLGFIHWYSASKTSNFNSTTSVIGLSNLSTKKKEDSLYNTVNNTLTSTYQAGSFTSYTNARVELSASKLYYINDDNTLKYIPTLIVSKELLYNGITGAMVNRFQYLNYNASVTASYDNQNLLNLGLQLMIKSHNVEFYIGSERLFQTVGLAMANPSSYANSSFTGADIFMGFSMKFGPRIEHPLNASVIPNGEKGFIGRLWNRLFKTYH